MCLTLKLLRLAAEMLANRKSIWRLLEGEREVLRLLSAARDGLDLAGLARAVRLRYWWQLEDALLTLQAKDYLAVHEMDDAEAVYYATAFGLEALPLLDTYGRRPQA